MEVLYFIIILIVGYLGYLILWGVVCLVAYSIALVFKKPSIIHNLATISTIVIFILEGLIGLGLLIYTISLLFSGQFIWFLIMIFFGLSLLGGILGFLKVPFMVIPLHFSDKIEKMNMSEEVVSGEILDKDNKVIGISEGDITINIKLARSFLIVYLLNVFSLIMNQNEYPDSMWGDYITSPFLWTTSSVLFVGLLVGIWNKVKGHHFFYPTKKQFLTKTLNVIAIIMVILFIIFLLLGVWII